MADAKTIKVQVSEDDEMIRNMYKTKLEADGYTVFTAANGAEALEVARKETPDIILLDVIMPQLDGFSVLEALKKDAKTKKIKVVMLTNLGTEEDVAKGEQLGAVGYLVKASLTPAQVSEKVKEMMNG